MVCFLKCIVLYFFLPGQLGYLFSVNDFYMKEFISPTEQTHYSVMKTKWLQEDKKVGNVFSNKYKAKYLSETNRRSPESCLYYSYRRKSNKVKTLAVLKLSVTQQTQGCYHTCRYLFFTSTPRIPRIILLYAIDFCAISLIDTAVSWCSILVCL